MPPISEVANRFILINSFKPKYQKSLITLAKNNPASFDKLVQDHFALRKNAGQDISHEFAVHNSWNHRRLLSHFIESVPLIEEDKRLCTSINIVDDEFGPWSKVDNYFRDKVSIILSDIVGSDLVQIEIPKIGHPIEQKIGSISVSNSLLVNSEQIAFASAYSFIKS